MTGGRKGFIYVVLTVLGLGTTSVSFAQEDGHLAGAAAMVSAGDSLRCSYLFEESLDAYEKALTFVHEDSETSTDSIFRLTVKDRMLMAENGRNMKDFVDIPDVVARQKFSLQDFFLHYPLEDRSWRPLPNQLDSACSVLH